MTKEQWRDKKEEVLSKFRQEFVNEFYNYDPAFRNIAELLYRDADPYAIIEELIKDRKRLSDQIIELAMNSTVKPKYP